MKTFIPNGGTSATAFGINDRGAIVGQYVTADATPGFIRVNGKSTITINAPSGPNVVNAQGDQQQRAGGRVLRRHGRPGPRLHGERGQRVERHLTGTAIADPTIPNVPGEPGATFVFSQVLGINDQGIAVGYYGDSTTSQHGFLYNTKTGQYTFLDDPSEAFNNGVEVTQITGITNSGEITGFYSDANGVFHGFVATHSPKLRSSTEQIGPEIVTQLIRLDASKKRSLLLSGARRSKQAQTSRRVEHDHLQPQLLGQGDQSRSRSFRLTLWNVLVS